MVTLGSMTDPTELRAGNTDRKKVVDALLQAHEHGRLGEDELPARIEAAQSARTFGDLDEIVADLPIAPPSQDAVAATFPLVAYTSPPMYATEPAGPVGSSPENPLVLDGGWSSDKRVGPWEIPQFVRVRGSLGSVTLDCTEARTPHSVIQLWVDGDMGSITVIVPEGWAADADGLRKSMGSVHIKVPREPTMGRPIFVVNGSMGLGSFTVRHPNWFERRRLEKRLR